jgi:hypothetical protein
MVPSTLRAFGCALIHCGHFATTEVIGKVKALRSSPHQRLDSKLVGAITAIHIAPNVVAPVILLSEICLSASPAANKPFRAVICFPTVAKTTPAGSKHPGPAAVGLSVNVFSSDHWHGGNFFRHLALALGRLVR